jgi:Phage Tail Collar Domain
MKKLVALFLIASQLAFASGETHFPSGVITTTALVGGSSRSASAVLDVQSTTKGLGFPSMTATQMNAISSPRAGLAVYNSTTSTINVWNGSAWVSAGSGGTVYAADTGTANAYVISPSPAALSYVAGGSYAFLSANANTGASTLNVSSLGTKSIKNPAGGALVTGDILANQIVVVTYDGTNFQMVSPQGPATSSNTANTTVKRDSSGNFSAGTITATLSGNATSATTATNLAGIYAIPSPSPSSFMMGTGAGIVSVPFPSPSPSGQVVTALGTGFGLAQPTLQVDSYSSPTPSPVATLQAPNFQMTGLGSSTARIETGSDNLLNNPSLQAPSSATVVPGWVLTGGAQTNGSITYNQEQAIGIRVGSGGGGGALFHQDVTVGNVQGEIFDQALTVYNPTTGIANLQVCPRINAVDSGNCVSVPQGSYFIPAITNSIGNSSVTSVGVDLTCGGCTFVGVSNTVYVSKGYVGQSRFTNNSAVITPWVTYTPTVTGLGTIASMVMQSRQVGDTLQIQGQIQAGTVTATQMQVTLGYNGVNGNVSADLTKVTGICGFGQSNSPSTTNFGSIYVLCNSAGYLTFNTSTSTNAYNGTGLNGNAVITANSSFLSFTATIPIVGWGTAVSFQATSGGLNAGEESITAATSCPVGTIKEDGTSYATTAYPALFSAIGYTYGGSGSNFSVPNAQGVFERGAGSQNVAGITYTGTQGTTQGDQMQGHYHNLPADAVLGDQTSSGYNTGLGTGATAYAKIGLVADSSPNATVMAPISDGTNGTPRTGAETRPANISHLHCIRYIAATPAPVLLTSQNPNWGGSSTMQGTTTSGSFADPGSITGAVATQGTPYKISCVQATSLLGITCTLPITGNYQVCFNGYQQNSSATAFTVSELTDGANAFVTGQQSFVSAAANYPTPIGACGNYTATSTTVTFKIRASASAGTGTFAPTTFSVNALFQY